MFSMWVLLWIVLGLSNPIFASKPKLMEMNNNFNLLEDISFVLHCYLLSGSKPVFFDWLKDGHRVFNSSKVKIGNFDSFSTLSLNDLHRSDSGVYMCSVKNAFGNDSVSSIINVKGFYYFQIEFI